MGFPLFKLIVCLLLAGPLASLGWGHARVESPARGSAHLLEEWQGVMAENLATGSFVLRVRYTYGQDLVKQDRVTSPGGADTSDFYGYGGLGSVRVLIQGSGQAWSLGHKYLYCHAYPVNGSDPSGHDYVAKSISAGSATQSNLRTSHGGVQARVLSRAVTAGQWNAAAAGFQASVQESTFYRLGAVAMLGTALSINALMVGAAVASTVDDESRSNEVNLDTSTAIAFAESDSHLRYALEGLFAAYQPVIWETAKHEFEKRVAKDAGPLETAAAQELMSKVTVVRDNPSPRVSALRFTGSFGVKDKIIFGTGDQRGSITLSADGRFVRGAEAQGAKSKVILHRGTVFRGR